MPGRHGKQRMKRKKSRRERPTEMEVTLKDSIHNRIRKEKAILKDMIPPTVPRYTAKIPTNTAALILAGLNAGKAGGTSSAPAVTGKAATAQLLIPSFASATQIRAAQAVEKNEEKEKAATKAPVGEDEKKKNQDKQEGKNAKKAAVAGGKRGREEEEVSEEKAAKARQIEGVAPSPNNVAVVTKAKTGSRRRSRSTPSAVDDEPTHSADARVAGGETCKKHRANPLTPNANTLSTTSATTLSKSSSSVASNRDASSSLPSSGAVPPPRDEAEEKEEVSIGQTPIRQSKRRRGRAKGNMENEKEEGGGK